MLWIWIVGFVLLFRCCCCNQRQLIKLLSSIADADGADTPAVAADQSTAVVVDAAADPELCQSDACQLIDDLDHSTAAAAAAAAAAVSKAKKIGEFRPS